MNAFLKLIFSEAAGATEATVAPEPITVVTEFSDLKIPALNIILAVAGAIILIAALIAAIALLKDRAGMMWIQALLYGISAFLVSTIIFPSLLGLILSLIPGAAEWMDTRPELQNFVAIAIQMVAVPVVIFVGMLLLKKMVEKRHWQLSLENAAVFGASSFLVALLTNSQLMFFIQYTTYALTLNAQGFDSFVSSYLTAFPEATVEEAIAMVKDTFVNVDTSMFVINSLYYVLQTIVHMAAAAAVFGVYTGKLPKAWIAYGILAPVLFLTPNAIFGFFDVPAWLPFVVTIVVSAVECFIMYKVLSDTLSEDWKKFNEKKPYSEAQKKREEKPKMPKIVMPND